MEVKYASYWLQEANRAVQSAKEKAEKASQAAEKHQKAIAKLTADNVVQLLRLKQAEAALASAASERDALQVELSNKQGPWYDQVRSPPLLTPPPDP